MDHDIAPHPNDGDQPAGLYDRLVGGQTQRNVFDSHLFACILSRRWNGGIDRLGLSRPDVGMLLARYFPAAAAEGMRPPEQPRTLSVWENRERKEIESLLLRHRAGDQVEEIWLASVIARACLADEPLWRGLGLDGPRHMTAVMARHFPGLVALNPDGGRWKHAIYRLLCAEQGLLPCDAEQPCTALCGAESVCFGAR